MRSAHAIAVLLAMLAGLIVWAVHFALMYGTATLACTPEAGWNFMMTQASGVVFSVTALVALAAYGYRRGKGETRDRTQIREFLAASTAGIAALSFIAVVWVSLPWLFFSDCRPV